MTSIELSPRILIAGKPEGMSPNMWVYTNVFGVPQWSFFFATLVLVVTGLFFLNHLTKEESDENSKHLNSVLSGIALVYLFTIQMGSHLDTKQTSKRLMSLSVSVLTLMFFIFYTSDITAEMTSDSSEIPVRNFEDVIYHDYRVIVHSAFYGGLLEDAGLGTAKHEGGNSLPGRN